MQTKMVCNSREKTISVLKRAVVYIKQIHDDAEADHDRYGDRVSYETMIDTAQLLPEIDVTINRLLNEGNR